MISSVARRALGAVSLLAASALVLGACGGGDGADPGAGNTSGAGTTGGSATSGDGSSQDTTASEDANAAYGLDLPRGTKLTPLGSDLALGDTARVGWQVDKNKVGVAAITVTKLRRGSVKDFSGFVLDEATQQSTPYYVDATVRNLGRTDLSGVKTPLFMVDGNNVLVGQSTFRSTFTPCAAKPLPEKFKPGRATKVCLVYIAADHGTLAAVSFRPDQAYDPIQWTGELTKAPVDKPKKNKSKNDKG
ncbi:hypothetical protein [Nocardioides sp.]|uniref:hypothetical protein n=1 Tax=Nocardioides sp. TaxID=35761 RepID=UPI003D0EAEE3